MRHTSRFMTSMGLVLAASLGAMAAPSCVDETSGEEVTWALAVQGLTDQGEATSSFENARGWTVELEQANLLIGPLYFYSGAPRASLFDRLLGIQSAYACAAHAQFQSGETLGEVPMQFGVDLMAGETLLAEDLRGSAGRVQSFELHLQEPGATTPGNDRASQAPTSTLIFAGTASKDGQQVPFAGQLTLPEEGTIQAVDSIPANLELADGDTLRVGVRLDRWFQDVDFSTLEQTDEQGQHLILPGTQAYGAMTFSVRSRKAFDATLR